MEKSLLQKLAAKVGVGAVTGKIFGLKQPDILPKNGALAGPYLPQLAGRQMR